MSINVKITDGVGYSKRVEIAESSRGYGQGLKTYSYDGLYYNLSARNYFNETNGSNMAVDSSFGGTPDGIHNGTDSVLWTASALSGSWIFNSTAQANSGTKSIDATSTTNNEQALFFRSSPLNLSNYIAFTGFIYLTSWSALGLKNIKIYLATGGSPVSDELNISNYIDITLLNAWQKIIIPLIDFNITNNSVDEIVITTVDSGAGSPPNYYLDDLQFEETSGSLIYNIIPRYNEIWEVLNVSFNIVDAYDSTVVNGTVPGLPYNSILGVSALTNGIQFQRISNQEILFNSNLKNTFDIISGASNITHFIASDGTNTMLKITRTFSHPIRLVGKTEDQLRFILNDDLSGLLEFKCVSSIKILEEVVRS